MVYAMMENQGIRHIEIQPKKKLHENHNDLDDSFDLSDKINGKLQRKQSNESDEDLNDSFNFSESTKSELQRKQFLHADSDNVNLDSLLQAVIDISDRLHEQEDKLVKYDDYKIKIHKEEHNNSMLKKKEKSTRPRTAVLRYTQSNSPDNDSDNESYRSATSKSSSSTLRSKRSASGRPLSAKSIDTDTSSKLSMSFSNDSVRVIDMENQRLLREILRNKSKNSHEKLRGPIRVKSAASINRSKKQQEIDQENIRLLNRLQAVKPTGSLSRDKLMHDHVRSERTSDRLSKTGKRRPASAPISRFSTRLKSREGSVLNFDNASVSSSRAPSSNSSRHGSSKESSTRLRKPRKVIVKETWEPGW